MAQAEFYRGVVSHKRWHPNPHGFAYELYMVLLDLDGGGPAAALSGLWPYASGTSRWALSCFREEDHLRGCTIAAASAGDTLSMRVRRELCARVPGYAPSAGSRVLLLTHLCNFGYAFNPISLYYVVARSGAVECMLAEVSNTPWNEMHLYPLHPSAPGVRAGEEAALRAGPPPPPLALAAAPLPLSSAAQRQLLGSGAVAPLDFEGLAGQFSTLGPSSASSSAASGSAAAPSSASEKRRRSSSTPSSASSAAAGAAAGAAVVEALPHLRYTWAKDFHVSPFFGMDHIYDWRFSQPNGSTLLVQSANWRDGQRVFTTQLMLERQALTRASLAYMLFWAFPLLTFRIQWWIHYEAFRLWWKGVGLFPHPTGARNAFVDAVEGLVLALLATGRLLSCCCGRRAQGHGK